MELASYYRINRDTALWPYWFLDSPVGADGSGVDAWLFANGIPYQGDMSLSVPIGEPGPAIEFNHASMGMIVMHRRVSKLLREYCPDDLQIIPVDIAGADDAWDILNVTRVVDCIDDERSHIRLTHGIKKPGKPWRKYISIPKLVIDRKRAGDAKMFRLLHWEVAIVVDEKIKALFEEHNVSGATFVAVTPA